MNRLLVLLLSCLFIFAGFSQVTANEDEERAKEFEELRVDVDKLLAEVYKDGEEEGAGEGSQVTVKGAEKVRMSGELRIRQNWWSDYYVPMGFRPSGFANENFAHMRTRLRFDFDVVEDVAAVVELQDVRVLGNPTFNVGIGNATTQVNSGFDLKRGEMIFTNVLTEGLGLEMGRFVMSYGDQRLIGGLEWVDQGRTYDGFRASYDPEGWYVDAFGTRQMYLSGTGWPEGDLIGFYGGKDSGESVGFEAYAFQLRNLAADTSFWTLGTRIFGDSGGFHYTGEFSIQRGNAMDERLSAGAFAITGKYTAEDNEMKPGVRAEVAFAQGDRNPGDGSAKTFQTIFPTNHMHYGYADLVGWMNIWDVTAGVFAQPWACWTFSFDWHYFQLHHAEGGWYNAPGLLVRPGDPDASSRLGNEMDIIATWRPINSLSVQGGWGRFFPGSFVRNTGDAKTADFLYVQAHLKF